MFANRLYNRRKFFKGLHSLETFDDNVARKFNPKHVSLYENLRVGALATNVLCKFTPRLAKCPVWDGPDLLHHRHC